MRISADALEALRAAIAPADNTVARDAYRSGDFPRADAVHDLDKRYRWDLFWHVRGHQVLEDAGPWQDVSAWDCRRCTTCDCAAIRRSADYDLIG